MGYTVTLSVLNYKTKIHSKKIFLLPLVLRFIINLLFASRDQKPNPKPCKPGCSPHCSRIHSDNEWYCTITFVCTKQSVTDLFSLSVTSEAEERAKKEAEERAQQQQEMDPQEAQTQSAQSEAKEDKVEGETPDSAEVSRPPDGNAGQSEQEAQPGSSAHQNPPLHNGTGTLTYGSLYYSFQKFFNQSNQFEVLEILKLTSFHTP